MAEELVGIIGGTGLGDALAERIADAEFHDVDTPLGKPSTAILLGSFGKRNIAFLSRPDKSHTRRSIKTQYNHEQRILLIALKGNSEIQIK
jgi:purine nucleoside phosphorylase